jgi:predicted nucleic acid-binding protein
MGTLYLDTSAVLRAVLEVGTTPEIETQIRDATSLVTSRPSSVEASRAIHRLRQLGQVGEARLSDAEREIYARWTRCDFCEITAEACETATRWHPAKRLWALDAIHPATLMLARQRIPGIELLTADSRMRPAADGA